MRWPVTLGLSLLLAAGAFSQDNPPPGEEPSMQLPDVPKLYFDALSFRSDQPRVSRLDVYIQVPYEALRFTHDDDGFHSVYGVTIDLLDSADHLASEKFWTEKIDTREYDESVSPWAGKLSQKSFSIAPGTYTVSVQVSDEDTKKTSTLKRKVVVRDFDTPAFSISDIMLVNRVGSEAEKKIVYPNISGNVADLNDGFYLFFETYNRISADTEQAVASVRNIKGDVVQSDTMSQPVGEEKKSTFMKINSSKLVAGDYTLDLQVLPSGPRIAPGPAAPAFASRSFIIHWRGLPVSIVDLDMAIDQMQYVAEKEKLDEMKKAPVDKKREMFRDFWKKKDPTPTTERNELMEEYYARVAYANKHFSHYIDGWKTDMGMVYIIFGVPSNIERHPFDIDAKPYEVWTYYEQNREFVFVDATGFGDYRLQNPIWDVWRTRPR